MKSRARIDPRGRLRGWLRGQTYAEFMMVVLPTISLIFGIFSFAMIIYTYSFLSNAARDAVRYAIVHGSKSSSPATGDTIQTYVRNEAKGINPSAISVTSCWNPQAPPNQCPGATGNNSPGKVVSVSVSYSYHPFYPFSAVTLPLTSSAQMVIDYWSAADRHRSFAPPHASSLAGAFLFARFSATNLMREAPLSSVREARDRGDRALDSSRR